MNKDDTLIQRDDLFPLYFVPQTTILNTPQYTNQQLYFTWQTASYVPFRSGHVASWVPSALVGKTNQQIWDTYGLALGGAIAPAGATTPAGFYGKLGTPATYPPLVTMNSAASTTVLTGYQLIYTVNGTQVRHPTRFNLHAGYNLITLTISGYKHTFFVYGGTF
jgi:hypothetical protein